MPFRNRRISGPNFFFLPRLIPSLVGTDSQNMQRGQQLQAQMGRGSLAPPVIKWRSESEIASNLANNTPPAVYLFPVRLNVAENAI
jgi:hypothetical protein